MSHVATIQCQVTDLDALEIAAAKLDAELVRGQHSFRAYERGTHCEHAIRLKDNASAFEVGLTTRVDGQPGWNLAFDDYSGAGQALVSKFGRGLVGLQNEYLAVVAERKLARSGWRVRRVEDTQARIRLVAVQ